MLNSNLSCLIYKSIGTDVYGAKSLAPSVGERCAVVRAETKMAETPPRAALTASKGYAWEFLQMYHIHLAANTVAALNDKVIVLGVEFRVVSMNPVIDVIGGRVDHYEVHGDVWD